MLLVDSAQALLEGIVDPLENGAPGPPSHLVIWGELPTRLAEDFVAGPVAEAVDLEVEQVAGRRRWLSAQLLPRP